MANAQVKMGVTGVSQFKQAMTQSKNSVKTLDEALKLNEKQFKATGDAQEYSQKKAELLRQKLEEQQRVVEQAEKALESMARNGVDKSSAAFQNMQREMLRAKSEVLDTGSQIAGIAGDADTAAQGVSDLAESLDSINSQVSFDTVTEGIGKITSGMESAIRKAWDLGAALVRNTLGAGAWADELATTAKQYSGIDPDMDEEKLQRMRKTSDLIDTSVESIIASKQKLSTALGKSSNDENFALLGIQTSRYGEIQDLDDLFWDTGEALMKVENEAKRAELGKKIFGNWTELIPLFSAGREEYEKTMDAQSAVSKKSLEGLTKMDDQYQSLQHEIETLKMEFLSELSPAVTSVMESLTGLVKQFNEYIQSPEGQEAMESLSEAVTSLFSDISNIDPEQAMAGLTGAIDSLKEAFEWIAGHTGELKLALEGIVGAWGALKLTGGALEIIKLVNGLKWLSLHPNIKLPGTGAGRDAVDTVTGNGGGDRVINQAARDGFWQKFGTSGVGMAIGKYAPAIGNLAGMGTMAVMAATDKLAGPRALRDGASWQEAIEAGKKEVQDYIEHVTSEENKQNFLDNWNPNSENANVIAKGAGDLYREWAKNGENTLKYWEGIWENLTQGGNQQGGAEQQLQQMQTEAREIGEELNGRNPELEEAWGLFEEALNAKEGGTATLMKDLAGRYHTAFDEMKDEPVIESVFDRLSEETGEELSQALETIGDGGVVDPYYAEELMNRVRGELAESIRSDLSSQGETLSDDAYVMGENTAIGLANGINDEAATAIQAAKDMAQAVNDIISGVLDINSPSKVMERLGEFVAEGFAEGINGGISEVSRAAERMAGVAAGVDMPAGNIRDSGRMVNVTLMMDSAKLMEVVVPLMDSSMGEAINLIRR